MNNSNLDTSHHWTLIAGTMWCRIAFLAMYLISCSLFLDANVLVNRACGTHSHKNKLVFDDEISFSSFFFHQSHWLYFCFSSCLAWSISSLSSQWSNKYRLCMFFFNLFLMQNVFLLLQPKKLVLATKKHKIDSQNSLGYSLLSPKIEIFKLIRLSLCCNIWKFVLYQLLCWWRC